VATVNGSSLFLLNRLTGEPIWDRLLGMNPAPSLAMNASFVLVPGAGGQMEAYRLPTAEDDHRVTVPWVYQAGGRVTAAPAIGGSTVSWGTEDGRLFVADLSDPTMLYQFQAGGSLWGQARFLPPDRWVLTSSDGYVTALDERTGAIRWDFSTGSDIDQSPLALADATYAVTRQNELFCISSEDGFERWITPGIEQVLACGKDRLYARGVGGTIVAIDRETGERIASLPAAGYQLGMSNYLTDRIYLMSDSGSLLCLREQTSPSPIIHVPLPTPPAARTERTPAGTSPAGAPATSAPPAAADADAFADDVFDLDAGAAEDAPPADDADADEPAASDIFDANDEPQADEPADEPATDEADGGTEETDDPFDFG
jgi:outer membrane protein assembly factor BamB